MDEAFLHDCLFFTTNRLGRLITKIAEEEFASTGFSPMYAYLTRLVASSPGISQKELAEKLAIAPSTLTRFVDKLEMKQMVERRVQGKTVLVYPTDRGADMVETFREASNRLQERYEAVLGKDAADHLTTLLEESSDALERKH
ncbi:MarR family transcriptional regulator [Cohnella lubricantis]|uniref:MarR family transcriptional regulator n=1 Tax=Cohnella lubricantis TaxID=2163172 RepID=A0A841T8D7_9BACL|nr:MarR family transcriptional regulator [Cohnella lubricantis]MBB6676316.1 MarR family transcriptional regulator [Cohnella lubricantis]MBP2119614.1 DNA-binding MarR family transcriptional regulator [Cohnella lubricantis]